MIYQNNGELFSADGKTFTVGGSVYANRNSDYMGLFGTVTEIRTGADRETDDGAPDICCAFDPPETEDLTQTVEERFSALYGMPKKIDEIGLDCVVMAPAMLEPISGEAADTGKRLYFLSRTECCDGGIFHDTIGLSERKGVLLGLIQKNLAGHSIEMVLTEAREDDDRLSFVYEAKAFKVFNYLHYTIADAPVLGGDAA